MDGHLPDVNLPPQLQIRFEPREFERSGVTGHFITSHYILSSSGYASEFTSFEMWRSFGPQVLHFPIHLVSSIHLISSVSDLFSFSGHELTRSGEWSLTFLSVVIERLIWFPDSDFLLSGEWTIDFRENGRWSSSNNVIAHIPTQKWVYHARACMVHSCVGRNVSVHFILA